ncbi:MAG: alpha-ketoacid dehydrogenase subunit beta [Clostridiales Family XIII bacterium]|jgi:pyruvate dehydrogenase E1 component beta subunit|nr:alpha-ketoacid dehydrogenase subunit beta [Clostridiales Family XIII bacterium]
MSLGRAFNLAMREEMTRDEKVICIGEDIGVKGGCWFTFSGLYGLFGDKRVLEMPMTESAYTYFGVGTALMGYRPIVEFMFADFATLGFEGIVDMAAKIRYNSGGKNSCPITFVMPQGGGGKNGCHHSQSVESWFANVPGVKIVAPTAPADIRAYYRASIQDDDPVVFIFHRALLGVQGEVPDAIEEVPALKNAGKLVKEGKDLTIVGYHRPLLFAQAAAAEVETETGKSIEIIDPRVLCPFDKELLFTSVRKTGRLFVTHEAPERGGFSAQIVSWVAENCQSDLKAAPVRVCGKNSIIPFGDAEDFVYPSKEEIKAGILKALA